MANSAQYEQMEGILKDIQLRLGYLLESGLRGINLADYEFVWEANIMEVKRLLADLKMRVQELARLLSCFHDP